MTSLICGLAPDIWTLVGARVAQGITGALIIPQVLFTFHATLNGQRHGKAIGYYSATIDVTGVQRGATAEGTRPGDPRAGHVMSTRKRPF